MTQLNLFESLTIINSVVLAVLPLAFFRRQKLQEIKYKEIMELNTKLHDITRRADRTMVEENIIAADDYKRLAFLISRFKKHSVKLSQAIGEYKELWDKAVSKTHARQLSDRSLKNIQKVILAKSDDIREMADKLLK